MIWKQRLGKIQAAAKEQRIEELEKQISSMTKPK